MTADRQQDALERTPVEDPLAVVIALDSSVEFSTRDVGTQNAYVAHDRKTGKFYRFGAREFHAAEMMDGRRTLSQIHETLKKDGLPWSAIDVVSFARELTQHRLASVVEPPKATDNGSQLSDTAAPKDSQTVPGSPPVGHSKNALSVALRFLSGLLTQRFPIASGDRVASSLLPVFGRCFTTTATLLWTILVVSGIGIVWAHSDAFASEIRRVFDQQLWLLMALLWCGLKLVHECGHAVCAKKHGVHVGKMGVMLFLMAPLAYVDVTDAWKLVRRRDRVQIALAGIYVELAIGAVAAWIWWCSPVGFTKHLAAQVFLIAGPATLLVNANPLLRLDGYYVLSDLLEIPNLRALGRQRLTALIEAVLFRLPVPRMSSERVAPGLCRLSCCVLGLVPNRMDVGADYRRVGVGPRARNRIGNCCRLVLGIGSPGALDAQDLDARSKRRVDPKRLSTSLDRGLYGRFAGLSICIGPHFALCASSPRRRSISKRTNCTCPFGRLRRIRVCPMRRSCPSWNAANGAGTT